MIPCASGRRSSLTPSRPEVGSTAFGASAPDHPTLMRPLPLSMTTQGGSLLNGVGEGANIAPRASRTIACARRGGREPPSSFEGTPICSEVGTLRG
eukprot:scaffold62494_cov40-Phaeocystis_antarctica.AAC.4